MQQNSPDIVGAVKKLGVEAGRGGRTPVVTG